MVTSTFEGFGRRLAAAVSRDSLLGNEESREAFRQDLCSGESPEVECGIANVAFDCSEYKAGDGKDYLTLRKGAQIHG